MSSPRAERRVKHSRCMELSYQTGFISSHTTLLYQCSRHISRSHPISRSTDLYLQIYRSVLLHCLTLTLAVGTPHLHSEKFNRELRARNARHPKSSVQEPTISSIYSLYSTYTLSQHPHYKINNYSRSIAEARTSPEVQHRSLHDVYMAPESLLDLPHVQSLHCLLMWSSC